MSYNTLKKIARYAELRKLPFRSLKRVYREADLETRKLYKSELESYFEALEGKRIKPGESIVMSVFGGNTK